MKLETAVNYFGSKAALVRALGFLSRASVERWQRSDGMIPEQYARRLHDGTRSKKQMLIWFPEGLKADGSKVKGKLTFDPSVYGLVA